MNKNVYSAIVAEVSGDFCCIWQKYHPFSRIYYRNDWALNTKCSIITRPRQKSKRHAWNIGHLDKPTFRSRHAAQSEPMDTVAPSVKHSTVWDGTCLHGEFCYMKKIRKSIVYTNKRPPLNFMKKKNNSNTHTHTHTHTNIQNGFKTL